MARNLILETQQDMEWLQSVYNVPKNIRFAILTGNEDSPDKIEGWTQQSPTMDDKPEYVWMRYDVACPQTQRMMAIEHARLKLTQALDSVMRDEPMSMEQWARLGACVREASFTLQNANASPLMLSLANALQRVLIEYEP